jgi:hypothetical protein
MGDSTKAARSGNTTSGGPMGMEGTGDRSVGGTT